MNRITSSTLISIGTLGLGLFTVACSSSSDKPTAEEYDDTAQAIASTTASSNGGNSAGDVASMADAVSLSLGVTPSGISLMGNGHFHGSRLGVDYDYALTCQNAAGVAGVCGALTDRASVDIAWSGTLSTSGINASMTRNGSWTISGLQGDTATFAGDSDFSFDATIHPLFRPTVTETYAFDASASYDAVKISTQDRQVIGGSAAFDVSAQHMVAGSNKDVDASFEIHAELTFHADHTADLTLDGSQHYTVNLTTGAVVRAN